MGIPAFISEDLARRWRADTSGLPAQDELKQAFFADLCASYGEAYRRYHTLSHIAAVFDLVKAHAPQLEPWGAA